LIACCGNAAEADQLQWLNCDVHGQNVVAGISVNIHDNFVVAFNPDMNVVLNYDRIHQEFSGSDKWVVFSDKFKYKASKGDLKTGLTIETKSIDRRTLEVGSTMDVKTKASPATDVSISETGSCWKINGPETVQRQI